MSTRYRTLPSQVLAKGTTFDLHVANVGLLWEQHQRQLAEAKANGHEVKPKAPKLTEQDMLNMIKRVRSKQ